MNKSVSNASWEQQTHNGANYEYSDAAKSRTAEAKPLDLGRELRSWSGSLIIMGILHFVLAGFLEPVWGVVLVVLGILNLVIRSRGMFIANGLALLAVGLMNIFSGGVGGWAFFGALQMYWGVKEMVKFAKYA